MVYMKLSIDPIVARGGGLSALALTTQAIEDHIIANGCEFEPDAASRSLAKLGIDPDIQASELSDETLSQLGDVLEDMETNCPHKGQGGPAKIQLMALAGRAPACGG